MDRRTIVFIIALSLAFFGLQIVFQQYNLKNQEATLQSTKMADSQKEIAKQKDILARTATLEQLPVYAVSADVVAVADADMYVALCKNDGFTWKKQITLSGKNPIQAALLTSFEQFALYKKSGTSTPTHEAIPIPAHGTYDIQLVSFDRDTIAINLAELVDGDIRFPSTPTTGLAIALMQQSKIFRTLGFFDPSTNTIQPLTSVPSFAPFVTTPTEEEKKQALEVAYYAMQNSYQQLVFSNKGAALVEINLPFQDANDKKSVVLPIDIDRELVRQSPQNALFPLQDAQLSDGSILKRQEGGYYPLLRRNLFNSKDTPISQLTPRESAFNIVSEYPEVAELLYTVQSFTDKEIVFVAAQPHRRITKTYTLPQDPDAAPYCFTLKTQVDGDARGLWLTSGILDVEWISGGPAPQVKYLVRRQDKQDVEQVDLPKEAFHATSITPDWIADSNGFFGIIMDPIKGIDSGFRVEKISGIQAPSRLTQIDRSLDRYKAHDLPGYELFLPVKPTDKGFEVRVFAGPFADDILTTVDSYYAKEDGGTNSDYTACQTFHGWFSFISEPFARFLFFLMKFFHRLFGSWALCIVLVTIVLRVLLYPLNTWSMRSMKNMQIVAPKIRAIQEKYKKEPQKAQMEILALYREYKVNPLSGCLPMLLNGSMRIYQL